MFIGSRFVIAILNKCIFLMLPFKFLIWQILIKPTQPKTLESSVIFKTIEGCKNQKF